MPFAALRRTPPLILDRRIVKNLTEEDNRGELATVINRDRRIDQPGVAAVLIRFFEELRHFDSFQVRIETLLISVLCFANQIIKIRPPVDRDNLLRAGRMQRET